MAPVTRRAPVQREAAQQTMIRRLVATLGGTCYTLGVRRRRTDYHGTMQTPGLPDLIAFLPVRGGPGWRLVMIECKAKGGRVRADQETFRKLCVLASVPHVIGDFQAFVTWCVLEGFLKADQLAHYRVPA